MAQILYIHCKAHTRKDYNIREPKKERQQNSTNLRKVRDRAVNSQLNYI